MAAAQGLYQAAREGAPDPDGPMYALAGDRLLEAWDRGAAQDPLDRALTMLAVAQPGAALDALARLSIPARDRALLRLRWISFGPSLAGVTACASCAARLEFSLSVPPVLDRLVRLDPGDPVAWTGGGATYTLRAATTEDLRAAVLEPDEGEARRRLVGCCVSIAGAAGGAVALAACADVATMERFDRLHEGAEIACEVLCPQCASVDVVDLDIGSFLWDEVRHAAVRLLREVHDLASAYGWSEAAITAMSSIRRRAYLEMVWT